MCGLPAVMLALMLPLLHAAATSDKFKLHLLDLEAYPMARCLDGSPGGYYISHGSGSGKDKFIIHLIGGGWCADSAECLARSKTELGTSSVWGSGDCGGPDSAASPVCTADGGVHGMLSSDPSINPLLHNWNRVTVNYCDGGCMAGQVEHPVTVGGQQLYFRGKYILDAVFDELLDKAGLKVASEVVISGTSAGGVAVFTHADYLADKIQSVNSRAKIVAAPGAGFFLDAAGYDGVNHFTPNVRNVHSMHNVSGFLNDDCERFYTGEDNWHCFFAQYTLPFVKTPLFISNSLADQVQFYTIMALMCNPLADCNDAQLTFMDNFGQSMKNLISSIDKPRNGAFIQSCFTHLVEDVDFYWQSVKVNGQTQAETFSAWYTGIPANASTTVMDQSWGRSIGGSNPTCTPPADIAGVAVI